jgi:hypothetical protein
MNTASMVKSFIVTRVLDESLRLNFGLTNRLGFSNPKAQPAYRKICDFQSTNEKAGLLTGLLNETHVKMLLGCGT